jgi:hypothetical protein
MRIITVRPYLALTPVLFAIALGLFPGSLSEAADQPSADQIKAVFLLNFTKFIEWPPESMGRPDSTFNICVLGNDALGSALDQVVSGEAVYGRKVTVQKVDREPSPGNCKILYFGEHDTSSRLLEEPEHGVLTVGESERFARDGGMIGFVIENRRVSFVINRPAADAAGLRLSSKLLAVAKAVTK